MRFLRSTKLRIFLVCWIVFSVHFSTNIVREHYPAFTLIENGDFVCDRYQGWHDDIFAHTDGHSYVGNNVLGSVIAAVPLLVFDPVLDALEAHGKAKLAEGPVDTELVSKYPNSRRLFRLVRQEGLDLRFGASAVITSAFLMAPLSALFTVLLFQFLLARGLARERAVWLAFLFAFATPVLFRTSYLNHNMFLMQAAFGAFLLLWRPPDASYEVSLERRLWAGFLCGCAFALDYAGAIPAAILYFYFLVSRRGAVGWTAALRESVPVVLAGVPPVLFLLWSQWAMYGDPFTPGQFVMRPVNYTELGLKGMTFPTVEVFVKNLVSPSWGLIPYAPILAVAFWPRRGAGLVVPPRERRWFWAFVASFLLFCASNQYSLMQFNTGFRYLVPLLPFLFLLACDHLARWPVRRLAWVSALVVFHSWVLTMMRQLSGVEKTLRDQATELGVSQLTLPGYWRSMFLETSVPVSYRRLVTEGVQLRWIEVLTSSPLGRDSVLANPLAPYVIVGATVAACVWIWRAGAGAQARAEAGGGPLHSGGSAGR